MAPRDHLDDEIIGYRGGIGPGGSVSLWPVRVRDQHRRGRGCCLGTIALLVLGIVAAWVLEHVVARPRRPTRGAARAAQHRLAAAHARPAAVARLGTPGHPGIPGAPGVSRPPVGSARA